MTEPAGSAAVKPIERRIVVAPGVELHVEVRIGDKSAGPLLLFHGLAAHARLWGGVAEHLPAARPTAGGIDHRGHRLSHPPRAGHDPRAAAAYLPCFRTRPDGTIEARLQRGRHLSILRSLWEHRPSTRWATLKTPTLPLLADSGDSTRTSNKRKAEAVALAAGGAIRSVSVSPGHHDLHLESPERVADLLMQTIREGFFK